MNKENKMKTQIFKSYDAFLDRLDRLQNGVSPDHAKNHPTWEADNSSNAGCWNCVTCLDCIDCTRCTSCSTCTHCYDGEACNNCFRCVDCKGCEDCISCTDSTYSTQEIDKGTRLALSERERERLALSSTQEKN